MESRHRTCELNWGHPWATNARYAGNQLISPYGYVSRDRKTRFPAMSVVERLYKQRAGQFDAAK